MTNEYNFFQNYNDNIISNFKADVAINNKNNKKTNKVLGYIEIPKINVYLPIFAGCSKYELNLGVGHLEKTSMPIGGLGTHCVLAGHTGIRRRKIFDDIHELDIGDSFFINVLNIKLEYEVDNIMIVNPDDNEAIKLDDENDFITLVTCTPRGENTKRLLVRGRRKKQNEKADINKETKVNEKNKTLKIIRKNELIIIAIVIGGIIVAIALISLVIKKTDKS